MDRTSVDGCLRHFVAANHGRMDLCIEGQSCGVGKFGGKEGTWRVKNLVSIRLYLSPTTLFLS